MLDKEIAEIANHFTNRLTFIQWVVGIQIPAVLTLFFGLATLLLKFFKDFKADAGQRMKKHEEEVRISLSDARMRSDKIEGESRENTENLIEHEGKINGIIQVCKERHGK